MIGASAIPVHLILGTLGSGTIEHHEKWHARRILEQKSNYILDGWIFEENVRFDLKKLLESLEKLFKEDSKILRLKGIFRTEQGNYSIQSVNGDLPVWQCIGKSPDSRLEIIKKSTDSTIEPAIIPFNEAIC